MQLMCTYNQDVIVDKCKLFCISLSLSLLVRSLSLHTHTHTHTHTHIYKARLSSFRNAKELEFMQLRQGGKSIAEYTAKFEELCKFSTIYQGNPNERWKCMKYKGSLREDILVSVASLEIRNFAALVNKCCVEEDCTKRLASERSEVYKKKYVSQGMQCRLR